MEKSSSFGAERSTCLSLTRDSKDSPWKTDAATLTPSSGLGDASMLSPLSTLTGAGSLFMSQCGTPGASSRKSGIDQVDRAVVLVGLKLGMRVSQLHELAAVLVQNGFSTRRSLEDLTDYFAEALGLPLKLAAALRDDAVGPPAWQKAGRVPTPPKAPEAYVFGQSVGPGGARIPKHIRVGILSFESALPEDMRPPRSLAEWMHPNNGFPSGLRDYLPTSPPRATSPASARKGTGSPLRRPASPAEPRAHHCHLQRQASARQQRHEALHELHVSHARRESHDAYRASSFHRRTSCGLFLSSPRRTMITGTESPLQLKDEMPARSSPSSRCSTPRGRRCPSPGAATPRCGGGGATTPRCTTPRPSGMRLFA